MNFYDHPQTLLENRYSRLVFRKFLAMALTVVLLGFSAEAFAQPIKLGYAALSAGQVTAWMAKEGGYLKIWHRSGSHLHSCNRSHPGTDRG